jgi:hypothetical protein
MFFDNLGGKLNTTLMENKKTTELLDLLWEIENTPEEKQKDSHWHKYNEVRAELEKRPPFNELIGQREETNEFSHAERLNDIDEDLKLLKRHKHDDKSGDVLVRI